MTHQTARSHRRDRPPRRRRIGGALIIGGLVCLGVVGLVGLFGDNLRAVFGASADSLAGNQWRESAYAYQYEAHKNLRAFGTGSSTGSGPSASSYASSNNRMPTGHSAYAPASAVRHDPTRGEGYQDHGINPLTDTRADRFSTFAVDVDSASYTLARRKLLQGTPPPPEAVRVEEFLNYFRFDYPEPGEGPFGVYADGARSPFDSGRHLVRIGLQGVRKDAKDRQPASLVFLVDVSGSMSSSDKLPLAKRALRLLVDNLGEDDTVALVTYAGRVSVVLPPTTMAAKAEIHAAIESLTSGGGTAMGSGMDLAYDIAGRELAPGRISRVIVLSDGDANIGRTSANAMLETIRGRAEEGVTLTTVGFGTGNYQDATMERLADAGNGNYYYCDSIFEARRVFQEQLGGTLEVIAKDVKVQIEWDPSVVRSYRLIGYENRDIADRDFRNDRVDAGEIGAGHNVTAVYEVELARSSPRATLGTVRVRHKAPRGERASEQAWTIPVGTVTGSLHQAAPDLRFAVGVVGFAEKLRGSAYAMAWDFEEIQELACGATEHRPEREELCQLLGRASGVLDS